ncbi:VOC family protein [Solirubrobacter taibaiensis]|nr:VOC family protein [Solirubrobacter taibaiensis]
MTPAAGASSSVDGGKVPIGIDALELWVADLARTADLLERGFGFERADAPDTEADDPVVQLRCGGVTVVLRSGVSPGKPTTRHVATHGDTVGDVALLTADSAGAIARAEAFGLDVSGARIDMTGDGTIRHTVRAGTARAARGSDPLRPTGIDHIACCVPHGQAATLTRAYEAVFGLDRVDMGDAARVGSAETGMRSVVLRAARGGFIVVIIEPTARRSSGQTQRFLDAHGGPGVQHAAMAYDDLSGAVEALRARGVAFLDVPVGYYEGPQRRLSDRVRSWDELRRLEILVDDDGDGLLFQLFTHAIGDRSTFFFELIQRSGATGFGANNVRALFAAVEAARREEFSDA